MLAFENIDFIQSYGTSNSHCAKLIRTHLQSKYFRAINGIKRLEIEKRRRIHSLSSTVEWQEYHMKSLKIVIKLCLC